MELVEVTVPAEGWQGRQRLSELGARECAEVLRGAPVLLPTNGELAADPETGIRPRWSRIGTVESARPVGERVACMVALHEPLPEGTALGLHAHGKAVAISDDEPDGRRRWVLQGVRRAHLELMLAPGDK